MAAVKSAMKIVSFNSTGLNDMKVKYINQLLDQHKVDIIFLQETWLVPKNLQKLGEIHQDYLYHGVSGINDKELLRGRPYGGTAILWHKSHSESIKKINLQSKRLCAVTFENENHKMLLINCYMPCDNFSKTHVQEDFLQICDDIELIMGKHMSHHTIIGGDMNVDFSRGNAHDKYLNDLMLRCEMQCVWELNAADCDYTFADFVNHRFSCIDHFFLPNDLMNCVNEVHVIEDPMNLSNHSPIVMDLNLQSVCVNEEPMKNATSKIAWHKVNINDPVVTVYQKRVTSLIKRLVTRSVYTCCDISCKSATHIQELNDWCDDLIDLCLMSDSVFPRTKQQRKRIIPGWQEEVMVYKEESLFWFSIWKSHNRPKNGIVYNNMKNAKAQYAYAVRRLKRRSNHMRNKKFMEALSENKHRDFFKEVRKLNPKPGVNCGINGFTNAKDIANELSVKYRQLYNSVPSDKIEMDNIEHHICNGTKECSTSDALVTYTEICKVVENLKREKSDGDRGLISNHLIYAGEEYHVQLSRLITSMLIHGHQPSAITGATIASIPKDYKGDLTSDANYRGIALSSAIGKVVDAVFLQRNRDKLCSSDLQFAFKPKMSTTLCTLVLKEVLRYYTCNSSPVYACSVDASKAFDRIRHDKLFQLLIDRNVPALDLRLLLNQYQSQTMRTSWKGENSDYFSVSNGIKQGGLASPTLFCVYMDELLKRIEQNGSGCWMGHTYLGAICYADDLIMICPSHSGLQKMIKCCELFGQEYGMLFNPTKSACIAFSKKPLPSIPNVHLMGNQLQWVQRIKHLGNYISSQLSEEDEINFKKGELISKCNMLLANMSNVTEEVKMKVFQSQCCSFHGSQAWHLRDKLVQSFHKLYNRCIRRVLQIPYATHTAFLPHLSGYGLSLDRINRMFLKLYQTMITSDNIKVRSVAQMALYNAQSLIGNNIMYCQKLYGTTSWDAAAIIACSKHARKMTAQEHCTVEAIKDLKYNDIDILKYDELCEFLFFLCVK